MHHLRQLSDFLNSMDDKDLHGFKPAGLWFCLLLILDLPVYLQPAIDCQTENCPISCFAPPVF
jgi:hypothetical protein